MTTNPVVLKLAATRRQLTGKAVKTLRKQGKLPAVLYGHALAPQVLTVEARLFEKVYAQAGASTLIEVAVENAPPIKALIQAVARHHLTLKPLHADFYQVSMTEKLTAEIPLKFVGEAPAIKELGGVLAKNLQNLKVECLPQDLVHEITVDLTSLKTFDEIIVIKDLVLPLGITLLHKPEEVIALVQKPRVEEPAVAVTPPSEKEAISEIKVETEEKKTEREKAKEKEKEKE